MTEAVPASMGPGEGETLANPLGESLTVKLTGDRTGGSLTMLEISPAPGNGRPLAVSDPLDEGSRPSRRT
jgi:hypothetical protein